MDKVIINIKKEDPLEVISEGELVEIDLETNMYRKCKTKLSPYLVGVCVDKKEEPNEEEITYNFSIDGENYIVDHNKDEIIETETANIQIAGLALVKTTGIVCVGDLLVSSDIPGVAEAVRYKHDWINLGKIIGKVMEMTENEDECIALIAQM